MAGLAIRATVHGRVQGVGYRAATVEHARALGLLGWVRNEEDGSVATHAEGEPAAIEAFTAFLHEGPPAAQVERVELTPTKVEGHEQFAVRGVPAGRFVVAPEAGGRLILGLEVDGAWRCWRLTKPPSMVPAEKRFASELPPEAAPNLAAEATPIEAGRYEQGGRVPWPEAIDRGHAVFVLHGQALRGGFALQRTRGHGPGAGWLLIKRRDAFAAG